MTAKVNIKAIGDKTQQCTAENIRCRVKPRPYDQKSIGVLDFEQVYQPDNHSINWHATLSCDGRSSTELGTVLVKARSAPTGRNLTHSDTSAIFKDWTGHVVRGNPEQRLHRRLHRRLCGRLAPSPVTGRTTSASEWSAPVIL